MMSYECEHTPCSPTISVYLQSTSSCTEKIFCMSVRDHTLSVLINPIVPHKPNLLLFFVTELSHGPKRIKKNWGKFSRTYPVFVL